MPGGGGAFTPPWDLTCVWLRPMERARRSYAPRRTSASRPSRTVSVSVFEPEADSASQESLVDVEGLLHTYQYAVDVWQYMPCRHPRGQHAYGDQHSGRARERHRITGLHRGSELSAATLFARGPGVRLTVRLDRVISLSWHFPRRRRPSPRATCVTSRRSAFVTAAGSSCRPSNGSRRVLSATKSSHVR